MYLENYFWTERSRILLKDQFVQQQICSCNLLVPIHGTPSSLQRCPKAATAQSPGPEISWPFPKYKTKSLPYLCIFQQPSFSSYIPLLQHILLLKEKKNQNKQVKLILTGRCLSFLWRLSSQVATRRIGFFLQFKIKESFLFFSFSFQLPVQTTFLSLS